MDTLSGGLYRLQVTTPRILPNNTKPRFSSSDADNRAEATGSHCFAPRNDGAQLPRATGTRDQLDQPHSCDNAANCALLKTFGTPELLENILSFFHTSDILRLRVVSRAWNKSFFAAPFLRPHYFVNPQWSRHPQNYQLLDLKLPGLTIGHGQPVDMGHWIQVRMTFSAARQIYSTLGNRRRRSRSILVGDLGPRAEQASESSRLEGLPNMPLGVNVLELFVCLPPICGMQAFSVKPGSSSDSNEDQLMPSAQAKLHCESGIKLGFLAETALSLFSPKAENDEAVVFKAIVSFAAPSQDKRKRRTSGIVTML